MFVEFMLREIVSWIAKGVKKSLLALSAVWILHFHLLIYCIFRCEYMQYICHICSAEETEGHDLTQLPPWNTSYTTSEIVKSCKNMSISNFPNCWAVEFYSPRRLKSIVHDFLFQRVCPELDFKKANEVIAMGSYTNAKISPAVPRIIMDLGDRFPAFPSEIYVFEFYMLFVFFVRYAVKVHLFHAFKTHHLCCSYKLDYPPKPHLELVDWFVMEVLILWPG